ncbi:hypothetical protein FPV67DRAFT_1657896, partial [Lyophyllum atratum]
MAEWLAKTVDYAAMVMVQFQLSKIPTSTLPTQQLTCLELSCPQRLIYSGLLRKPEVESLVYSMDSDNDSETTTPDPPPKKVRKVRSSKPDAEGSWRKRTRGRQGSLEQISGMPLDILFEIFAHLTPYDLLNLSRTSKPWRNILMHRSSTYVWKRMSVSHRKTCPNVPTTSANLNTRISYSIHTVMRSTGELGLGAVKSVIPANQEQHCSIFCFGHSRNRYAVPAYCLRTLRRYKAEMKGLSNPAFQEWHIAKRTEYQAQMEHAGKCEVWNRNRNEERSNELGNIRRRRFEAIKEKLSLLGWGEEIAKLEGETRCEQLSDHKLVKQPRELTDRIWDNIEESLIEFMEKTKSNA